ncbi:hypothetical protein ACJX0J_030502, partial [Zea mays]
GFDIFWGGSVAMSHTERDKAIYWIMLEIKIHGQKDVKNVNEGDDDLKKGEQEYQGDEDSYEDYEEANDTDKPNDIVITPNVQIQENVKYTLEDEEEVIMTGFSLVKYQDEQCVLTQISLNLCFSEFIKVIGIDWCFFKGCQQSYLPIAWAVWLGYNICQQKVITQNKLLIILFFLARVFSMPQVEDNNITLTLPTDKGKESQSGL